MEITQKCHLLQAVNLSSKLSMEITQKCHLLQAVNLSSTADNTCEFLVEKFGDIFSASVV